MSASEDTPPARLSPWRRWHRARLYLWSLLLVVGFWPLGGLYLIRTDPQSVVDHALNQLPYPSSARQVTWKDRKTLEIKNIQLGDFFYADSLIISASWWDLYRHHLARVTLTGAQVFTGPLTKALETGSSTSQGINWFIDQLDIKRGTVLVDAGPHLSPIPVRIGVFRPVTLYAINLDSPDSSAAMQVARTVELENINILSPFDALAAPVFTFPLLRVRFTYAELWHHQIRQIELIQPTMFLGQDLFWLTDELKQDRNSAPVTGPESPWQVGRFEVKYGKVGVHAFGQEGVVFPFVFQTQVDNIRLDQLDKITAQSSIDIDKLSRDYPDYKVRIDNLTGKLAFSLPPNDAHANNVVNTLHIDSLSWNEIAAQDVSSSVTFDPNGIYGKLSGTCEGGLINGNFEVYYTNGFSWNADFFAYKINSQPIAQKMAGSYLDLTGALDGKLEVKGKATEILKCDGALVLPQAGLLEIKSADDLLSKLPPDTVALKRDALKIAIAAIRTYPYNTGTLKINYTPAGGEATLNLDSPNGKRDFGIFWHPFDSSKVAKADDTP